VTLADFDYELPHDRIAHRPAERRDDARLMVVTRGSGGIEHARFRDLPEWLTSGDRLVLNETRVIPARLIGLRPNTGGRIELLLVRQDGDLWEAMARPARRLRPGTVIAFPDQPIKAVVEAVLPSGNRLIRFVGSGTVDDLLLQEGRVPLPPYIRRDEENGSRESEDRERYQTVYSRTPGAVAAPTAGLHFTPELLRQLKASGVPASRVLLHVGPGTFKTVEVEDVRLHEMDGEYGEIKEEVARAINATRRSGSRSVAVGTTSVRLLETAAAANDEGDGEWTAEAWEGWTRIFIYPPYEFRLVDALITNFHLPRSTLLMLVAAFAGRDLTMEAYRTAIAEKYRFYSYGDAMLIL
jgi:S-adenosylmethionine:tRNA ribosyltransferase-isomerase